MTERKGQRTRATIVATTGGLLRKQGYAATGLNQIVDEAKAPKGSLYFHFPGGKDELVASALGEAADAWRDSLVAAIADAPDLATAIVMAGDLLALELETSDYLHGCPLATVTLEAAATNALVQRVVADRYGKIERLIAERVMAAGIAAEQAEPLALLVLSSFEGVLVLARAHRNADLVRRIARQLAALVP
jgi:TetR/AcrR family transcriptional repressor of lmrAB and yxaGH operons